MKLTAPRVRALKVLADSDREGGRQVRRSNQTGTPSPTYPCVYWQTADWLVAEGLAVEDPPSFLTLSDAGRELVAGLARSGGPDA